MHIVDDILLVLNFTFIHIPFTSNGIRYQGVWKVPRPSGYPKGRGFVILERRILPFICRLGSTLGRNFDDEILQSQIVHPNLR